MDHSTTTEGAADAAGHGPLPAELPTPPHAVQPRSGDGHAEEEEEMDATNGKGDVHRVMDDDDEDGDGDDDEQHDEADTGMAANSKEESGGIEIGRFFRYKWLPSRRARQTTIQKMEMQQLQRRFEAREMADILRYRANASSRRRRRQRNAAAASSSSSSSSQPSSSADEGESGSGASASDDDSDTSSSSSSSSSSPSTATSANTRRSREHRKKKRRRRRAEPGKGDKEEEGNEKREDEDEEGEQKTAFSRRIQGRAVALSTRRRREPSGDGGDTSPRDSKGLQDAAAKAEEEEEEKKKKKKKQKRKKSGEEADVASENKSKRARAVTSSSTSSSFTTTTTTTTKCAKCNTYNCLRACPKAMCSRCCPLQGEPCRAHADRSRRTSLNAKRAAERAGSAQRSGDAENGDEQAHTINDKEEEKKRNRRKRKVKVEYADAEAVAESTNEGGTGRPPGPTSSPHLKEEVRRTRRRQSSSQLPQQQQHRKCALCHANNYLRLCPKAMCRVCCPKAGPMCSPHALKESLKATVPVTTQSTSKPLPPLQQQQQQTSLLDPFSRAERLDDDSKDHDTTATTTTTTTTTSSGGGRSEERDGRTQEKPSHGDNSPPGLDELRGVRYEGTIGSSSSPAIPSPSLSSLSSAPLPPPGVVVTLADDADGSSGGRMVEEEEERAARNGTSLAPPPSPSSNAPSGEDEDNDDQEEEEEEEESSTHALAFFLKNAAAACSRSAALENDALSPPLPLSSPSSSSSLDSILAALPSAAPPYALDLDPSALLGVKRKHPTRCVQCNSNNALGACPKSCCSICCPKDGQRCPAHSHKRGSSAASTSSLRVPPAKRLRNLSADTAQSHSPEFSSSSLRYAFNDAGEGEPLPPRRSLRSDDARQVPLPSPAASVTTSTHRTLKCVHCNSYNMLHSCALQMCSICCHKSPRGPCAAHVRRSGEVPPADHMISGAASGTAGVAATMGGTPLSSPDLSSSSQDERRPKPRGRPKGSTKKKKLEELARLMREHGEGGSASSSSLLLLPSGAGMAAATAAEVGFQAFLYPAPSLPPPPLGRRAPARSPEASSRRAKQHTLARMRQQQWLDDHDDDEEEEEDDEDVEAEDDDDDDEQEERSNGNHAMPPNEYGDDAQDHAGDDEDEEDEDEDEERSAKKIENGASSSLLPPPKRKRGRPPKAKPLTATMASPLPPPHDVVAMTLSTFRHASDPVAADSGRGGEGGEGEPHQVAARHAGGGGGGGDDDYREEDGNGEWARSDAGEAPRGRTGAALATAKAEPSDEEGKSCRAWGDMPVEEVLVDDLLFLVCGRDHRADFVRGMAEPTFLYAPKKGASHYARRSKRQSIRGASCSNCHKPKSTSWREGWIPRDSTSPIMLCHGCGTRYGKEMFCTYCHYIYMADEDWNTTKWIGCDSCTKWIHKKCEEIHIGRLIDVKAYYQCPTCRGEVTQPPPIGAPPVAHDETETFSD